MNSEKTSVALTSMAASAGLAVAKFIVALTTGSLGLLSEAVHSLIDFGATVLTWLAVRVSDKPADRTHPYGHGKIESVAALVETGLLMLVSVWVTVEAARRLITGDFHVEATWWAIAVILASIAVDYQRARALRRVAAATRSQALEADALHFSSDMWSSVVVLGGLLLAWWGAPWGDAVAAMVVAGFVALAGWRLGERTIATLIDAAPAGALERVEEIAAAAEGVLAVERVRVRPAGPVLFVDVDLSVRRTLPFDRVDAIKTALTRLITAEFPEAEVVITSRAIALDDETVGERVLLIAGRYGVPVHHITVQKLARSDAQAAGDLGHAAERLSVSFDVEVDGAMTLGEAHRQASRLEGAIREELGPGVEVESHIEPMHMTGIDGQAVEAELTERIRRELTELAAADGRLGEVHNVRVRRNEHGLFVTFHCRVPADRTVEAVHDAVDAVENAFQARRPEVRRVIAHAEPLRSA